MQENSWDEYYQPQAKHFSLKNKIKKQSVLPRNNLFPRDRESATTCTRNKSLLSGRKYKNYYKKSLYTTFQKHTIANLNMI